MDRVSRSRATALTSFTTAIAPLALSILGSDLYFPVLGRMDYRSA
jgi:hypothetical protein